MRFTGSKVEGYLADPFLAELAEEIQQCGPIRPAVVDLTHKCNLRCKGCYFFEEEMDKYATPRDEEEFDAFVQHERSRGTNYMTVVGGEPALQLRRLKKLHNNFHVLPYTNGIIPIPRRGLEKLKIAISLWGGHETDKMLRGNDRIDVFAKSLKNYVGDDRVVWYYTTTPGNAHEVMPVVDEIVGNGNLVMFSFYEDHAKLGDRFDHRGGFARVKQEIARAIERYPASVLTTNYLADVGTSNRLYGHSWGHDVCPVISADNARNEIRIRNENPYNAHMRCYLPDLKTTRRCPVGDDHDCSACYNVLARVTWVVINQAAHLETKQEFTNWLTSTYIFYVFTGIIERERGAVKLRGIHERVNPDCSNRLADRLPPGHRADA
jgi:organic radical activating enzyme